jgi:hypothetical protein
MHVTMREAWTDERLDDLANRVDNGFREVRAEMARQKDVDARFDALMRMMQIGFTIVGVMLAALLGLIGIQL